METISEVRPDRIAGDLSLRMDAVEGKLAQPELVDFTPIKLTYDRDQETGQYVFGIIKLAVRQYPRMFATSYPSRTKALAKDADPLEVIMSFCDGPGSEYWNKDGSGITDPAVMSCLAQWCAEAKVEPLFAHRLNRQIMKMLGYRKGIRIPDGQEL